MVTYLLLIRLTVQRPLSGGNGLYQAWSKILKQIFSEKIYNIMPKNSMPNILFYLKSKPNLFLIRFDSGHSHKK